MQALLIIVNIIVSIAYAAMAFFASYAFFALRRQQRDIREMKDMQRRLFVMGVDQNVRDQQQAVSRMAGEMKHLVENDRFEEAERMKKAIDERMRYIASQLAYVSSEFGDECEVKIVNTGQEDGNE
ncbi:MAG: hypothetical protein IJ551_09565 [Prevotella sp.]|nr:hypothetical protein [Prevotella sp.]